MELFGEKLREVRESKKYSIDQVARETRISKHYLIALENEDFTIFPGETYLVGFLKSYAEYLDLDPDHFVNLYKNIKIQEQPIPFDALLDTRKKVSPLFIALTVFLGVALAAAVGFILFLTVFSKQGKTEITETIETIPVEEETNKTYVFNDEVMTDWFRKGDIIIVPLGENEFPIKIMVAEQESDLKIVEKPISLTMGNEESFDLNTDGKLDIKLILNDFKESETGNEINLGLYKINVSKLVYTEKDLRQEEKPTPEDKEIASVPLENSGDNEIIALEDDDTGDTASTLTGEERTGTGSYELIGNIKIKEETKTVIMEAEKPEPFIVSLVFRESCLFRYIIDGNTRDNRYFTKNDTINLPGSREILMYIQNAYSVKATIAGKSIVMGKAGQIVTKIVYWAEDSQSGKYRLEIASVY